MKKINILSCVDLSLGRDFRGRVTGDKGGEVLVVQAQDVLSGTIENIDLYVERGRVGNETHLLEPYDILFTNKYRYRALVVSPDFIHKHKYVVATSGMFVLRPKKGWSPYYLAAILNSDSIQNELKTKTAGRKTSVKFISRQDIDNLMIPDVTDEVQSSITKEVIAIAERHRKQMNEISALRRQVRDLQNRIRECQGNIDRDYHDINKLLSRLINQ